MKDKVGIFLDESFCVCERGNIWLAGTESDNQIAYFHLDDLDDGEMLLLEMSMVPENYPGLDISIVRITPEALAEHIRKKCGGWYVKKLNLVPENSVNIDTCGCIIGREDDCGTYKK